MLVLWRDGCVVRKVSFGDLFHPDMADVRLLKPDKVTWYNSFTLWCRRETGVYRHRSASAVLDEIYDGTHRMIRVELAIEATPDGKIHFKDGQELYLLIREGQILPERSFERQQISWPPKRFRDIWREVRAVWKRWWADLEYRYGH